MNHEAEVDSFSPCFLTACRMLCQPSLSTEAMTDVSSPEFGVLQAKTDVFKGRVVQLAGRIVGIEESASGTIILARELPVEKHPVFGPAETNKPTSHLLFISRQGGQQRAVVRE